MRFSVKKKKLGFPGQKALPKAKRKIKKKKGQIFYVTYKFSVQHGHFLTLIYCGNTLSSVGNAVFILCKSNTLK